MHEITSEIVFSAQIHLISIEKMIPNRFSKKKIYTSSMETKKFGRPKKLSGKDQKIGQK